MLFNTEIETPFLYLSHMKQRANSLQKKLNPALITEYLLLHFYIL